jgi:hypothetical protein
MLVSLKQTDLITKIMSSRGISRLFWDLQIWRVADRDSRNLNQPVDQFASYYWLACDSGRLVGHFGLLVDSTI